MAHIYSRPGTPPLSLIPLYSASSPGCRLAPKSTGVQTVVLTRHSLPRGAPSISGRKLCSLFSMRFRCRSYSAVKPSLELGESQGYVVFDPRILVLDGSFCVILCTLFYRVLFLPSWFRICSFALLTRALEDLQAEPPTLRHPSRFCLHLLDSLLDTRMPRGTCLPKTPGAFPSPVERETPGVGT